MAGLKKNLEKNFKNFLRTPAKLVNTLTTDDYIHISEITSWNELCHYIVIKEMENISLYIYVCYDIYNKIVYKYISRNNIDIYSKMTRKTNKTFTSKDLSILRAIILHNKERYTTKYGQIIDRLIIKIDAAQIKILNDEEQKQNEN